MNSPLIAKSISVEMITAASRLGALKPLKYGTDKPLFSSVQAEIFLNDVLENSDYVAILQESITKIGYIPAVCCAAAYDVTSTYDAEFSDIAHLLSTCAARERLSKQLSKHSQKHIEVSECIRLMHSRSQYWGADSFMRITPPKDIIVHPSLFMEPAPAGKLGFTQFYDGRARVHLVFGYHSRMGDPSHYLDWPQWYRMGVWHTVLYQYLATEISRYQKFLAYFEDKFQRTVPSAYRRKVSIHGNKVSESKTWADFLLDHLIFSYKARYEGEVSSANQANEQLRWFCSLGRSLLPLFYDLTQDISLSSVVDISQAFFESLETPLPEIPVFDGPLGACENPIWNHDIQLHFSPSVSQITQKTLKLWFLNYWKMPLCCSIDSTVLDILANAVHSHAVYVLKEDLDWILPIVQEDQYEEDDGQRSLLIRKVIASKFTIVYVKRHPSNFSKWIRLVIAEDEKALMEAHKKYSYFSDWTFFEGQDRQKGSIHYEMEGTPILIRY